MDDPDIDPDKLSQLEFQAKKMQRTAEDNTPEGIFPYVLFLLSRPPAFPTGDTGSDVSDMEMKQADGTYRSLRMVSIDVLTRHDEEECVMVYELGLNASVCFISLTLSFLH